MEIDWNHKLIRANLLKAVNIARLRENRLRVICDSAWCDKLRFLPATSLIKKFKFIIGNSSVRTVTTMYKRGLFDRCDTLLTFASTCVRKLHAYNSSLTTELLRGMNIL